MYPVVLAQYIQHTSILSRYPKMKQLIPKMHDTLECNGLFPHQLGPQTLISNLVNHFSRAFGENEIPGLT